MSLREILSGIAQRVEGCRGVVVMASDGIPIDEVVVDREGLDLQLLTVEYATILKEVKRVIGLLRAGETEELCVTSDRLTIVVRVLSAELFVIQVLDRDANLGKGRYLVRMAAEELLRELQ